MTNSSKEYAIALFELAVEAGETEETAEGLALVVDAMKQEPRFRELLCSPAIPREQRLDALDKAFADRIPKTLRAVLRMMVTRGQMKALEAMARDYDDLSLDYRGESVANVTTAVPLDEKEAEALRVKLEKRFNRKIRLACTVDPALIGGVRVEVDGRMIDGTIRNKLEQMREVMYS